MLKSKGRRIRGVSLPRYAAFLFYAIRHEIFRQHGRRKYLSALCQQTLAAFSVIARAKVGGDKRADARIVRQRRRLLTG